MNPLIKRNQVETIQVDEATVINRYRFTTKAYDLVEISVDGEHGTMKNNRSTKTYYITSGTGTFTLDSKEYSVETGDVISVSPEIWLHIQGQNLKALIITHPPFNADDELWK